MLRHIVVLFVASNPIAHRNAQMCDTSICQICEILLHHKGIPMSFHIPASCCQATHGSPQRFSQRPFIDGIILGPGQTHLGMIIGRFLGDDGQNGLTNGRITQGVIGSLGVVTVEGLFRDGVSTPDLGSVLRIYCRSKGQVGWSPHLTRIPTQASLEVTRVDGKEVGCNEPFRHEPTANVDPTNVRLCVRVGIIALVIMVWYLRRWRERRLQ
mmetsp:Transcript_27590/g.40578  ORF Transcript_27590/g.40578 Transcript_27590/m.40578 type:complete len:212 (-) Transcript_27590:79-714(-)